LPLGQALELVRLPQELVRPVLALRLPGPPLAFSLLQAQLPRRDIFLRMPSRLPWPLGLQPC
jgi:hypothetical protein